MSPTASFTGSRVIKWVMCDKRIQNGDVLLSNCKQIPLTGNSSPIPKSVASQHPGCQLPGSGNLTTSQCDPNVSLDPLQLEMVKHWCGLVGRGGQSWRGLVWPWRGWFISAHWSLCSCVDIALGLYWSSRSVHRLNELLIIDEETPRGAVIPRLWRDAELAGGAEDAGYWCTGYHSCFRSSLWRKSSPLFVL